MAYVWAAPTTIVGLVLALLAVPRGRIAVVGGPVEAHGPGIGWLLRRLPLGSGHVGAVTLGHVVIACDAATLECTRAHERVHVRQYERWGPFFLPAYVVASAWAHLRGRHPYFDNRFEREAQACDADA
jgi:hypothetical protein